MTVLSQYVSPFAHFGCCPIAFTIDATHDGPDPSVSPAWSDCSPSGITQFTCFRLHLLMSVSMSAGLTASMYPLALPFVQYVPVHTPDWPTMHSACRAFGAVTSDFGPGV